MDNKIITLDEAIDSLRGKPGLVYGQLATTYANSFSLILNSAQNYHELVNDIDEKNYAIRIDALRNTDPKCANDLERYLCQELDKITANNDLEFIVKAGWSVCISLTQDVLFESALQDYQDSKPNSNTVTVVDHPLVRPETRTIPVYKLLGNIRNQESGHSLAFAASDQLIRKNIWRSLLATCTDFLQGNPLIFVGTDTQIEMVQELLSNLSSMPAPAPNSLLFLKDDPILENPTITSLCNSFSKVNIIDSTIREFSKALKSMTPKQNALNLSLSNDTEANYLDDYRAIISVVPFANIEEDRFIAHRNELVDSLFKPNSIDWDPYLCNLDIIRSSTPDVIQAIRNVFDSTRNIESILIRGDAGVGKTTLLKRVAVELSKQGYITLWSRRVPTGSWMKSYRQLSNEICQNLNKDDESKIVVFVDDPWSLRIDPSELISCFEKYTANIVFVFSLRNTEYFNQLGFSYNLPFNLDSEIEISSTLTNEEFVNLGQMLYRIGAVPNVEEAQQLINNVPTKNVDDVLCSLWYLVPETRDKLSDSLKDEYHRLGSVNSSIQAFAASASQISGESAQHAYEYVAVASKFHIGLPMEVLVRTLKISYEDFIDVTIDGKPLWGLIYNEEDVDNGNILYRTRNEIVTKVLLDLVNGGVGHAGEFRALKSLLESCDIGSQIYREFAVEVLVRSSRDIEKNLSYQQGLELFEAVENSMPHEDRLLAHHKGIWMHRVGKEYQKAYQQFERALDSQQYPGSERESYIEYIHTSMAASVVGLVKNNEQNATQGLQLVKDHIQQAANPKIFSGHAGHVSANLLFELAQQQSAFDSNGVGASSYSEALRKVEITLQSIGPLGTNNSRSEKSIEMLKELQRKIIESIPNENELENYANQSFEETRSQLGFELLLRKNLSNAQIADKGSAYNSVKNKIEEVLAIIDKTFEAPSIEILAIRIDLIIRWRLQKPSGPIDWDLFRNDLQQALDNPIYRDDPIKRFYYAVALFHLGKIEQSNAEFRNLRRMRAIGLVPKMIRFFAVGTEGNPKRYQCTTSGSHGRYYAGITELNFDIPLASSHRSNINHTYIGFCLNGSIAIYDKPDNYVSLIP